MMNMCIDITRVRIQEMERFMPFLYNGLYGEARWRIENGTPN